MHSPCILARTGSWNDPEYGELRRHLLELGSRRILVNRQVRSRARRPLQVRFQHGRAPFGWDFLEPNFLARTVTKHDVATCGPRVTNPRDILPEHGHQVAFARDISHDQRQTDHASGAPADYVQSDQVVRGNTQSVDRSRPAVDNARYPIGASATI